MHREFIYVQEPQKVQTAKKNIETLWVLVALTVSVSSSLVMGM